MRTGAAAIAPWSCNSPRNGGHNPPRIVPRLIAPIVATWRGASAGFLPALAVGCRACPPLAMAHVRQGLRWSVRVACATPVALYACRGAGFHTVPALESARAGLSPYCAPGCRLAPHRVPPSFAALTACPCGACACRLGASRRDHPPFPGSARPFLAFARKCRSAPAAIAPVFFSLSLEKSGTDLVLSRFARSDARGVVAARFACRRQGDARRPPHTNRPAWAGLFWGVGALPRSRKKRAILVGALSPKFRDAAPPQRRGVSLALDVSRAGNLARFARGFPACGGSPRRPAGVRGDCL